MALSANKLEVKIKPIMKTAFEKITLKGVVQTNFRTITDGRVVLDRSAYNQAYREAIALAENVAKDLAKDLAVEFVKHVKTADITCTIMMQSISVVGSPSAQVGPPAPLNISGTLK